MSSRLAAPASRWPAVRDGLRRVGDAACALLCLWAALYHTPPGALLRSGAAHLFGVRAPGHPLLSYYSAGLYRGPASAEAVRALSVALPPPAIARADAPGWGAFVALSQLPEAERAQVAVLARKEGVAAPSLADSRKAPAQLSLLLARLEGRLGSSDLAALALFCGEEAAAYARRAAPQGSDLAALSRELPPQLCGHLDLAGQALALGTAASLGWPLAPEGRVTSRFGSRDHPLLPGYRLHRGIDLAVPEGTPVHAAGAGLVRRASRDAINGHLIVLDHGHGVTTLYLHNQALLREVGERIARSEVIARSGSTGLATGPHLHYQVELSGVPIDPLRLRLGKAPQGGRL
jgi:murein DD-endopeptidase MepM/ murein hydrolase activator NlpD